MSKGNLSIWSLSFVKCVGGWLGTEWFTEESKIIEVSFLKEEKIKEIEESL